MLGHTHTHTHTSAVYRAKISSFYKPKIRPKLLKIILKSQVVMVSHR